MCKPASFIVTHGNRAHWSVTTDSHHEIIAEHGLRETDARGDIALVPVEVTPPDGNLSLPLSKWSFAVDFAGHSRDLPEWWDEEKAEKACRAALKDWAAVRLRGWRVKEAFSPVHPFKVAPVAMTREEVLVLVRDWASVRDSVWASVGASVRASVWASAWASVGDSVRDSVWASVGASVRASVWASVGAPVRDSVWAYTGSLFSNIKTWNYTDHKDPWGSIRKLWISGYVPSFGGTTWRVHAYKDARVVYEFTKAEVSK
jgi:hypothetical protein